MNPSTIRFLMLRAGLFLAILANAQTSQVDLSRQIAEVMSQSQSGKAHERYVHAKGVVSQGSFKASPAAAAISRAPHFNGREVPITVRFSDGAPNTGVADNSPDAAPRGMAIRFAVGKGLTSWRSHTTASWSVLAWSSLLL